MFKSIYNGFWVPGETEYTGSSQLSKKHYVSESKTFFHFLQRSYGLVHHTPRNNEYNSLACERLFKHFQVEAHDISYKDGKIFSRKVISLCNLNIKPVYPHIMRMLFACTKDGKLVGDLKQASQLLDQGIDPTTLDNSGEDTTCCIGFNPEEQKWYGWSHRAMCGFGVRSKVQVGDCGYQPITLEDWALGLMEFYEYPDWSLADKEVIFHGKGDLQITTPVSEFTPGRGSWEARSLSDAKQMARDFVEGVS